MDDRSNLISVFTGSAITANILKEKLEEAGIEASVRDEFEEALEAGFSAGSKCAAEVFILDSDKEKANPVIEEFKKINDL